MSIDVVVVSKSESFDYTEFMTGLVRFGEIDATSVRSLVDKVISRAVQKSSSVRRLDVYAHGAENYFSVGKDVVHAWTPADKNEHLKTFARLKGGFAENGFLVLNVCEVGKSMSLITNLARAVGVKVYANTGAVSPNLGVGWGATVIGYPNGAFARTPEGVGIVGPE